MIESYIEDLTSQEFLANRLTMDAVERRLEIIGEASKQVDYETRERYPDIPWSDMARLRDVISHKYNRLNPRRIWVIATTEIPDLKDHLRPVIEIIGDGQ
ncbi:MAG: DUF86 domain-containing protein [Thermoplasmata archaeon]|nr:DUF86 domain-containing protein [Thermoplasmata archaeon]